MTKYEPTDNSLIANADVYFAAEKSGTQQLTQVRNVIITGGNSTLDGTYAIHNIYTMYNILARNVYIITSLDLTFCLQKK